MNENRIMVLVGGLILIVVIVLLCWNLELTIPVPPPYKQGEGLEYALKLAERAQRLSLILIIAGWISVGSASLLAIAGAVLGSRSEAENDRSIKALLSSHRGLLCTAIAIVLGGFGWQCIDRSTSATKTASVATSALAEATIGSDSESDSEKDLKAYKACVEAKCAWLEGRMNHDRLQSIVDEMQRVETKGGEK